MKSFTAVSAFLLLAVVSGIHSSEGVHVKVTVDVKAEILDAIYLKLNLDLCRPTFPFRIRHKVAHITAQTTIGDLKAAVIAQIKASNLVCAVLGDIFGALALSIDGVTAITLPDTSTCADLFVFAQLPPTTLALTVYLVVKV
jgi:hypothetical protein